MQSLSTLMQFVLRMYKKLELQVFYFPFIIIERLVGIIVVIDKEYSQKWGCALCIFFCLLHTKASKNKLCFDALCRNLNRWAPLRVGVIKNTELEKT